MFSQLTLDLKDLILRTCSDYTPIYSRHKKIIKSMTDDQHICLYAYKYEDLTINPFKSLIYQGNPNNDISIEYERYSLHSSVYCGNFDLMILIIGRNRVKINNQNLFDIALDAKNDKIIRYLLDRGVNIYKGFALFKIFRRIENVKILIDYGIDPNIEDKMGITLLYYAIEAYNLDIIKYLLEHGSDINHQDKYGYTELFNMSNQYESCGSNIRDKNKCYDIIKLLLDYGIDPLIKNNNGITVFKKMSKSLKNKLKEDGYLC